MHINNPKNELYQDFVQLVDNISTAIVKENIVPIAGKIITVTQKMQESSDHIQQMNKTISDISKKTFVIEKNIDNLSQHLSTKIENDIKKNLDKNINMTETKFSELNKNNLQLQTRINELQTKQNLFLFIIMGLITFFSIIMIYLISSIHKGMI
ncbi:hypothetical protein [Acinetobacter haemolyticus]|uniref:hypothetical protein n=1 Tax=Acinetobacter haemolyticus TaxID=29430 RepID=UPI000DE8D06C|nr:hypothetical protein [Acinetobacter haemolyticus]WHR58210.1 hypothetical protein PGW89_01780 [Acinetobacter haemolyticus]